MPFQVRWLIPRRIVTMYMYGTLALDDFKAMYDISTQHMEAGSAPVHMLSILDQSAEYSKSPNSIAAMIKIGGRLHPNTGWVLQITANVFQRFIGTMIAHSMGNVRYAAMPTPAEALAFLKDRDVTLSEIDAAALAAEYQRHQPTP
ncbi:MAG: hypothetical protein SF162_12025 [bacterium]|nr:hypothetical protein [bacterium]